MNNLWQDLRYGARMLLKQRSFTLLAVLMLALGIGATTAIFSIVNAVLLRPLPYPEPERLLYVGQQFGESLSGAGEPKYLFWREHSQSFEALACYSGVGAGGNLTGGQAAEYVRGLRVSANFFQVLGVQPALGRAFTAAEDAPGGPRVAMLGDALWRQSFGARQDIVGQTVQLNDQPLTVVGVLPASFRLGSSTDLLVPLQAKPTANYDPNSEVVGRLKPGVTRAQAQAELKLIAEQYRTAFPNFMAPNESIAVQSYQELFTGDLASLLWLLLGAVIFLLLIGCANVANLQLTRAATRQREIAVRLALGAGNGRIVRQLLTEGLLLALLGGAAGLLLAVWGTELLVAVMPEDMLPSVAEIRLDWRVLACAAASALVTGLLFGLAPAWQARKVDVNTALKDNGGKASALRGRMRGALVIAEVALALMLLVGAGLLSRTFAKLTGVAPGFDPQNVLTCQLVLKGERYDTTAEVTTLYASVLERLRRVPGVEAAAVTNKLPLDWQFNMPVFFPNNPERANSVQFRAVTPEYFRALRIPVQQGRSFDASDNATGAPVALVNAAFRQRFLKEQNPFAQQLSIGRSADDPLRQIVGIVGDTKQSSLESPAPPTVFVPLEQMPDKLLRIVQAFTPGHIVVRTSGPTPDLSALIKREIAAVDGSLPPSRFVSLEQLLARSIAQQRFNMLLVGLFAALGLLLAAVGIYGVMTYTVAQRTNEIGLRLALGAQARDVLSLVLRQGLTLALWGTLIGLAGAVALTRLLKNLVFGVSATDPLTFAAVAFLLLAVALLACYLPARRATKVDPLVALRYE